MATTNGTATKPNGKAQRSRKYDLVGTAEAAELLDVERSRIGRWLKSGVMPQPVVVLKATPVWRTVDITKLQGERERRRRPSRQAAKTGS